MEYRSKKIIEATQWFKNGDHPFDDMPSTESREGRIVRYFRHPGISGDKICEDCGKVTNKHGFLDNEYQEKVCPGNYIIYIQEWEAPNNPHSYVVEDEDEFEATHEPV